MKIAVIPARGGSKRIPRKNIKLFSGKPIIAHTIETALRSEIFDQIIVSTDDEEIAQVARDFGASTPFMRPKNISGDHTVIAEVMKHAADWLDSAGIPASLMCCLYSTAPLMHVEDIAKGLALIESDLADVAMAVTTFSFPIQRAFKAAEDGRLVMFYPEYAKTRSQDLDEAYHDAAQFVWSRRSVIDGTLKQVRLHGVTIDRYRVQDIDTEEDWKMAELLFKAYHLKEQNCIL